MHFRRQNFDSIQARRSQFVRDPSCRLLNIWLVFAFGADARDAQKLFQFFQVAFAMRFNEPNEFHARSSLIGLPAYYKEETSRAPRICATAFLSTLLNAGPLTPPWTR